MFSYRLPPARIVFGAGAIDALQAELARAGLGRAFVVSTPGRSADVARIRTALGAALAGTFEAAVLHVPTSVVAAARSALEQAHADCCVTVGGGSAIGLGKALALDMGLPLVSIPTTYSGSEMTEIWGTTEGQTKRTGRSPRVLPAIVLYDPDLTLSLPPEVSAASGMNAIAHAVEALYAPDAHPLASLLAEDSLRTFAVALPAIVREPLGGAARTDALRAAHFAGMALNLTTMGLHHKLCHVLGGSFGLPHAPTHAVLLPYVTAFNASAAGGAMQVVRQAFGADEDAAGALYAFNRRLGVQRSLRDLGLQPHDLEKAADLAVASSYPNPRPVARADAFEILRAAFEGGPPPRSA